MLGTKFQLICLLFTILAISRVNCMNMREEDNEILDDDDKKIRSGADDQTTSTTTTNSEDLTPVSGSTSSTGGTETPTTPPITSDSSSDESPTETTTPSPKRDTILRFIDDLFQVPLKMLKMFSNILSRTLETFTSRPTPNSDN